MNYFSDFFFKKNKYSNILMKFSRAIPGGKTRGLILPGDTSIPPGIDGSLFHFEMELFHFKMKYFHFIY